MVIVKCLTPRWLWNYLWFRMAGDSEKFLLLFCLCFSGALVTWPESYFDKPLPSVNLVLVREVLGSTLSWFCFFHVPCKSLVSSGGICRICCRDLLWFLFSKQRREKINGTSLEINSFCYSFACHFQVFAWLDLSLLFFFKKKKMEHGTGRCTQQECTKPYMSPLLISPFVQLI